MWVRHYPQRISIQTHTYMHIHTHRQTHKHTHTHTHTPVKRHIRAYQRKIFLRVYVGPAYLVSKDYPRLAKNCRVFQCSCKAHSLSLMITIWFYRVISYMSRYLSVYKFTILHIHSISILSSYGQVWRIGPGRKRTSSAGCSMCHIPDHSLEYTVLLWLHLTTWTTHWSHTLLSVTTRV